MSATPARLFVILTTGETARVITEIKTAPDGAPSVAVTVVDGACQRPTKECEIPRSSRLVAFAGLVERAIADHKSGSTSDRSARP